MRVMQLPTLEVTATPAPVERFVTFVLPLRRWVVAYRDYEPGGGVYIEGRIFDHEGRPAVWGPAAYDVEAARG